MTWDTSTAEGRMVANRIAERDARQTAQARAALRFAGVSPVVPALPPRSDPPPTERKHPIDTHLRAIYEIPERLTALSGEYKARKRELERERHRYSLHEFEDRMQALGDEIGQRARVAAESALAFSDKLDHAADQIEARHRPSEPEQRGRHAEEQMALERVKALVDGGHAPADIIGHFAADPAALRAYAKAAPSLHGAKLPPAALNSPEAKRSLDEMRVMAEWAAEQHEPEEVQIAREAKRQRDLALRSVTRHTQMVGAELKGQPADPLAVGIGDMLDAIIDAPTETGMEPKESES